MGKPILGISMGDPFGNSTEITVKALSYKDVYDRCKPLVVGYLAVMDYAANVAKKLSGLDIKIHYVKNVKDAKFAYHFLPSFIRPRSSSNFQPACFSVKDLYLLTA